MAASKVGRHSNPEPLRKSAQEVEIDHLLAEEFHCDPTFPERFLSACNLSCPGFETKAVVPEPSLGGEGFGDLLVEGRAGGMRVALLIEDKITAGPATRQAERYLAHADRMREEGWSPVWCILVAPAAYRGERHNYDACVALERVAELLRSPEPKRLAFRRGIIERALEKRAVSGVKVPDVVLHKLKSEYLEFVAAWCEGEALDLQFPSLRASYFDGDSWIYPIRHPRLPTHVVLRHRMWTSLKDLQGMVDLIATRADEAEQIRFRERAPEGSATQPFSNERGVQVSFPLPEMRQGSRFDSEIAEEACRNMRNLVDWYLDE